MSSRPAGLERTEIKTDPDDGHLSVWTVWHGVDRPCTSGMSVKDRKMAARLTAAIEAGAAVTRGDVLTDVDGRTYVDEHWNVLGRMLNADLRRLGY